MANLPFGTRFINEKNFLGNPMKLKNLEVIQIGESCLEPKFEVANHNQYCFEISYIISGSGFFYTNDKKTEVHPGDVIFTPNKGTHLICSSTEEKLFYSYIGFNFNNHSDISGEMIDFFNQKSDFSIHSAEDIYDCYKNLINEFCYNEYPESLLVESFLLQIIIQTYRLATNNNTKNNRQNDFSSKQLTYLVRKYVEENIFKNITVKEISLDLGYSVCHISHVFSKQMDIPLKKYISNSKISKAKELMESHRFTITEISEKLNFSNPQSFSRTFFRETGSSPSDYIKNHSETNKSK